MMDLAFLYSAVRSPYIQREHCMNHQLHQIVKGNR